MFKFIFFVLSLVFILLIQVDSLKLKSLCNDRITEDENYLVNSYYRMKFNKTLPSIGYLISSRYSDQPSQRTNSLKLKKLAKDIYSEKFVNNSKLIKNVEEKRKEIKSLKESYSTSSRSDYYNAFDRRRNVNENLLDSNLDYIDFLLGNFSRLKENYLTEDILSVEDLKEKMHILVDLDENQTSTFKDEFIEIFYEKELAILDGFKVHSNNPIYLDRHSNGTLYFSLYIPFYDKNQAKNAKSNCSCTDYLPKFFTSGTVPLEKNKTESSN